MSSYMSFELFMNRWFFCEWPDIEVQRTRGDAGSQTHRGAITWHREKTSSDLACSYAKSEYLQQWLKFHLSGYFFPLVVYGVSEVKMPWGPSQWECKKSNTYYRQVFWCVFHLCFVEKGIQRRESWTEVKGEINGGIQCSCISDFMKHTHKKYTQKTACQAGYPTCGIGFGIVTQATLVRGECSHCSLHHPCSVITKPGA